MTSPDIEKIVIPAQSQYILGVTSLWLLLPAFYGVKSFFNRTPQIYSGLLGLLLLSTSLISLLNWRYYHPRSLIWKIDVFCALTTYIALTLYSCFYTSFSIFLKFCFPICVFFFYMSSNILSQRCHFALSCLSHLTFRLFGFWWAYYALTHTNPANTIVFSIILTVIYYLHILLTLLQVWGRQEFQACYIRGTLQMAVIIITSKLVLS